MSVECKNLHELSHNLKRHRFSCGKIDETAVPLNGIYILFQKGEQGHQQDRIVRIGTHTGDNQLRSRLKQHFLNKNKDRSIFRKNIGRALLNQNGDSFLESWELDLTTREAKQKYSSLVDFDYQKNIEKQVSQFIQDNFSFCVFEVNNKEQRLYLESRIISTVSWCDECKPSKTWLGNDSPKEKIVKSGLWLVNELYKTPFDAVEMDRLLKLMQG